MFSPLTDAVSPAVSFTKDRVQVLFNLITNEEMTDR